MYKFLKASLLTDGDYYLLNRHRYYIDSEESFWAVQYDRESELHRAAFIDPIGVWHQKGINLDIEHDLRPVLHISTHFDLDFGTKINVYETPFIVLDANKMFALKPIGIYSFSHQSDLDISHSSRSSLRKDDDLYCFSGAREIVNDWFNLFFRGKDFELQRDDKGELILKTI